MTCIEFRDSLIEVVKDTAESGTRQSALDHAEGCAQCGRMLERERNLRSAFRAIREETSESAPAPLEAALMAAFEAQAAPARPAAVVAMRQTSFLRSRTVWALAAAAALAIAAYLMRPQTEPAPVVVHTPPKVAKPDPAPTVPAPKLEVAKAEAPATARPVHKPKKRSAPRPAARPNAPELAGNTTDFFALPVGSAVGPPERAQVLRVTMPRGALPGLGFPVNAGNMQDLIRADILVGDDSIARAIRFVDQNGNTNRVRRASYER